MKFIKITDSEVFDQNTKGTEENWSWFACAKMDVVDGEGKEYEVIYKYRLNTQELPNFEKKNEARKLIETIKPIYLAKEFEIAGFVLVSIKPIVRYN